MRRLIVFLLVFVFCFSLASATIYKEDITHYWNFSSDGKDSAGNLDFSSTGSISYVPGKLGKMAGTLYSTNFFSLNQGLLNGSNETCFNAWIKTASSTSTNSFLHTGNSSDHTFNYIEPISNQHYIQIENTNNENTGKTYFGSVSSSTYYYLSYSFKRNNESFVCINGVCETPVSTSDYPLKTYPKTIIGYQEGFSRPFNGYVDDMFITQGRKCTQEEINETYNDGAGQAYDSFPLSPFETTFRIRAFDIRENEVVADFNISYLDLNDSSNDTLQSQLHNYAVEDLFDDSSRNESITLDEENGTVCYDTSSITETTYLDMHISHDDSDSSVKVQYLSPVNSLFNLKVLPTTAYIVYNKSGSDYYGHRHVKIYVAPTNNETTGTYLYDAEGGTANNVNITVISHPGDNILSVYKNSVFQNNVTDTNTAWWLHVQNYVRGGGNTDCDGGDYKNQDLKITHLSAHSSEHYVNFTEDRNNTFNITFEKHGYADEITTLVAEDAEINYTFNVSKESVYITFKNETNNNPLVGKNVTISFIGTVVDTYETNDSTLFIEDAFPPGDYILRYEADGYDVRDYYLNIISKADYNISLYLLASEESTLLPVTITDLSGKGLSDKEIHLERYFVDDSAYNTVEMTTSSEGGEANLFFQPFSAWYIIKVFHNDILVKTVSARRYTTADASNGISIPIDISEDIFESYLPAYDLMSQYAITNDRAARSFTYSYNDASGIFTELCLYVTQINRRTNEIVNTSCSTSASATLVAGYPNLNKSFEAYVEGETSTEHSTHILSRARVDYIRQGASILGGLGIFMGILLISTLALISGIHPAVPIILSTLALVLVTFMLGLAIGYAVLAGFVFVAIATIVLMSWRSTS